MSVIKGQNLRVMVGGKCVALATSCQIHIAAQTEDSSTKDSTDDWQDNEVVGLSWDCSTDSLVTLEDGGANGQLPPDLLELMIAKTKVALSFDVTNGANNRVATNSALKKSGSAYITDINITAANRQNSTITVQFSGTGGLS